MQYLEFNVNSIELINILPISIDMLSVFSSTSSISISVITIACNLVEGSKPNEYEIWRHLKNDFEWNGMQRYHLFIY